MLLVSEKQGDDSLANGSHPVKKSFNETSHDFFNNRVVRD